MTRGRRSNLITVLAVLLLLAGLPLAVWLDLRTISEHQLELQARDVNSIISGVRGYYASNIVARVLSIPGHSEVIHNYKDVPGAIPIPATLSLELGKVVAEQQSNITYRFVSDFPFKGRAPHKLDAFETEALAELRADPKQTISDVSWSGISGQVRLVAPVLMAQACVSCHNTHPDSPKTNWKVGDVRGIQEVIVNTSMASNILVFKYLLSYFAFMVIVGVSFIYSQRRMANQIGAMNRTLALNIVELQTARDHAMEASRTKSSFLANMSHELRTPLNAIIGLTELMSENTQRFGTEKAAEPLRRVLRAGRHLLNLINGILDLSKIEAGKLDLNLEQVNLEPLLEEVMGLARPLAEANRNELVLDCPQSPGSLHADPLRLRQILLNLLSNACKFTRQGKVTLAVARIEKGGAPWLSFVVSDTGIGMNADQIDRLFQEFTQADASTTREFGGTGLGLAITRRLCQLMGGDVSVESAVGEGSTFTVLLPVASAEAGANAPAPAAAPVSHSRALSKGTVLVIDDDQTACELMTSYLGQQGYTVVAVASGIEGLKKARELRPMAITLDIVMPDLDGWTVLAALKGDPELARIPVIIVSIVDESRRGIALGAAGYLTKPIAREKLLAVLAAFREDAKPATVMVVEDDAEQRENVRYILASMGWTVREAANGRHALDSLRDVGLPDVVLLDLMMPEMDGFQMVAELQANPAWRAIPVVVMTSKDLTAEDRQRLNRGVAHIVSKNAESQAELMARIAELLADESRHQPQTHPVPAKA